MTDEYQNQVADIIAGQSRNSTFKPANAQELYVKNRRQPRSLADLSDIEQKQLAKIWRGVDDLEARLQSGVCRDEELDEDFPDELEVADITDAQGIVRYKLWGMNYGVAFLIGADSLECLAFAAQHDLEHWHAEQRDLFWAMDRAISRGDHGFQQPTKWCWWEDKCWAEIADEERGTVQSEPYIRAQFAGEN